MTNDLHIESFAPVVLFVYGRLWHTQQTVKALQENKLASETRLYVFADGARSANDLDNVNEVRKYLQSITGFKSVDVFESPENKGLSNSIVSGLSKILKDHERVIVLEDDIVTAPHFLSYMNQGLELYRDNEEVATINGYMFPVDEKLPEMFFLRGADCWGWATWRRSWSRYNANAWRLLARIILSGQSRDFNVDNSYSYTRLLFNQCIGRVDSWDVCWYATTFLEKRLSLYPGQSLVKNIGFDNSGTHTRSWHKEAFDTNVNQEKIRLEKIEIKEDKNARRIKSLYLKKIKIPLFKKLLYMAGFHLKEKN